LGDHRLLDPDWNHVYRYSHHRDLHGEMVAFDSWGRRLCCLLPQGLFENLSRYKEALQMRHGGCSRRNRFKNFFDGKLKGNPSRVKYGNVE
jgi:hypothetical protein